MTSDLQARPDVEVWAAVIQALQDRGYTITPPARTRRVSELARKQYEHCERVYRFHVQWGHDLLIDDARQDRDKALWDWQEIDPVAAILARPEEEQ